MTRAENDLHGRVALITGGGRTGNGPGAGLRVAPHDDDTWNATLVVNLTSAYWAAKAALRPMLAQQWGRIVNVGSGYSLVGGAGLAAYTTRRSSPRPPPVASPARCSAPTAAS